ncbi:MAG TPA: globin domain-containing protein, partial [Actinomycetes bacterium]|nr:globin domain-containing protein [Actinomycetes bacterium]
MPQHHDPHAAPDPLTVPWGEPSWSEPVWTEPSRTEPVSVEPAAAEPSPVQTGAGYPSAELHEDEIGMLEESLRLLEGQADRLVGYFYAALFLEAPHLRALFPAAMDGQRDRFFRALTGVVAHLREPERLSPMLRHLGRDHRKFGVRAEDYDVVGGALITALRRFGDDVWVPELEAAWVRAYELMAGTMLAAAREAAVHEPAWWRGEVVAHER